MMVDRSKGRIALRFTASFIAHQIGVLVFSSLPVLTYLYLMKGSSLSATYYGPIAWLTILFYGLYCVFYGYYVALPLADIMRRIRKLAQGQLESTHSHHSINPANKLYREIYRDLADLNATLKTNEQKRMEFEKERQEWASGVTHDLKTPLSYISGYSDLLLAGEQDWTPQERQEFLQIIKGKARYMADLIDDLGMAFRMDEQKTGQFSKEKVEIVELMRRILAECASLPEARDNDFSFTSEVDAMPIWGNGQLLMRAFSNLIINSIVHNPSTTAISVAIARRPHCEIRVTDNGSGMDQLAVEHLFDRYYHGSSTTTNSAGTGLGMAIAKQIIQAHGGTITVDSQLKLGTRYRITLPQADEA